MNTAQNILTRKLREHSPLDADDESALQALSVRVRELAAEEDLVAEGDQPEHMAVVTHGLVARYHARSDGGRQYLAFHMSGDLPDAQALYLDRMDHAVCALGPARVALISHEDMRAVIKARPAIGAAVHRVMLVDGAIFRAAISNLGSRPARKRMAHLFCELYYRARLSGIAKLGSYRLPLHQGQLGDALAMSLVTVNRTLQGLRRTGAIEFRNSDMTVHDWTRLAEIGNFDPAYLHLRQPLRV